MASGHRDDPPLEVLPATESTTTSSIEEQLAELRQLTEQIAHAVRHEEREMRDEERLLDLALENFSPLYFTLLSIIQGVALAYFAEQLTLKSHLTAAVWLQAIYTLVTIIVVWDQWSRVSLLLYWLPQFTDSAIPFLFGVTELYQIHEIGPNSTGWLGATALVSLMGLVSTVYAYIRAGEQERNRRPIEAIGRSWMTYGLPFLGVLGGGVMFALSGAGLFGLSGWLGPAIVLIPLGPYITITAAQWRRMLKRLEPPS